MEPREPAGLDERAEERAEELAAVLKRQGVTRAEWDWALRGGRVLAGRRHRGLPAGYGLELADLEAAAARGVWLALLRFESRRGVAFRTFAWAYAWGWVKREAREWSHVSARRQLTANQGREREGWERVPLSLESLPGVRARAAAAEEGEEFSALLGEDRALGVDVGALHAAIAGLEPGQARAVRLVYLAGVSLEEAARLLGIGKAAVYYRLGQARRRLRVALAGAASGKER